MTNVELPLKFHYENENALCASANAEGRDNLADVTKLKTPIRMAAKTDCNTSNFLEPLHVCK